VVKYTENEAYRDFRAGVEATWSATLRSMQELGYPVQEGVPYGSSDGRVEINDAKVVVEPSGGYTRVRVRVGVFSNDENRRRAGEILDRIARYVD
jgi:hypothetical protein